MRVSVVIPVHNEAENIRLLLQEIHAALASVRDFEVVVVDDGSTDETFDVLRTLQHDMASLRLVRHQSCCGQSTALITGIRAAVAPLIATLDGDGQNDPADLPAMIRALESQNAGKTLQMIAGFRNRRRDSSWRLFCSKVANAVRSRILRDDTPDSGCGIKVFHREAFLRMPQFNHMHRFLPGLDPSRRWNRHFRSSEPSTSRPWPLTLRNTSTAYQWYYRSCRSRVVDPSKSTSHHRTHGFCS